MEELIDFDPEELRERILYALFRPVVSLAAHIESPLSHLKKRLETAYFHETRRQGLSMREAMRVMSVSISKATGLSRQLKRNFADQVQREHGLPRRIEYVLWAEPLSAKRLTQALPGADADAVASALELLLDQGRVRRLERSDRKDPVYQLAIGGARRVWNSWLARFDGLDNALDSVTRAIVARFFNDDPRALARTVMLHVRRSDMPELERFYEETFFPFLAELDGRAADAADAAETEVVSLSLFWSTDSTPPEEEPDEEPSS